MLIGARQFMADGKRRPYDAEVEYLESTGTQWIDTGVDIANSDDARFVTTCTITNTVSSTSSTWVGSGVLTTGGLHYVLESRGIRTGGGDVSMAIPYNRGDVVTIDVYYDSQHRRICKIGQSIYQGTASSAQTAKLAILNYPQPPGITSYQHQAGKLFHVEVYKSGALVRDFIPVRKGNVGYLYDRVTGRLFGNAGSGDFVLGPDVVPVKYLASTGTQWIDTGVPTYANARMEFGFMLYSTSTAAVFGNIVDANSGVFFGAAPDSVVYCNNGLQPISPSIVLSANTEYHVAPQVGNNITINGIDYSTTGAVDDAASMYLFARRSRSTAERIINGRVFYFRITANDIPLRSFRPVRVGSGSTWEGAMMDVLTRRIYRNAGTGAFTYGNDLKYPIPAE